MVTSTLGVPSGDAASLSAGNGKICRTCTCRAHLSGLSESQHTTLSTLCQCVCMNAYVRMRASHGPSIQCQPCKMNLFWRPAPQPPTDAGEDVESLHHLPKHSVLACEQVQGEHRWFGFTCRGMRRKEHTEGAWRPRHGIAFGECGRCRSTGGMAEMPCLIARNLHTEARISLKSSPGHTHHHIEVQGLR